MLFRGVTVQVSTSMFNPLAWLVEYCRYSPSGRSETDDDREPDAGTGPEHSRVDEDTDSQRRDETLDGDDPLSMPARQEYRRHLSRLQVGTSTPERPETPEASDQSHKSVPADGGGDRSG